MRLGFRWSGAIVEDVDGKRKACDDEFLGRLVSYYSRRSIHPWTKSYLSDSLHQMSDVGFQSDVYPRSFEIQFID